MDDQGQPADRDGRIRPQGLFSALSRQLPDNAILSSDSGSAANWYARQIKIRRGMKAMLSGNLATMLPGVPLRDRREVRVPGSGLDRDGRRRRDANGRHGRNVDGGEVLQNLADPRMIVLVLNNEDLNQVTWEQRVMEGDPKFEASQDIPTLTMPPTPA